jgi:predicted P-loop ATPase/GTPase
MLAASVSASSLDVSITEMPKATSTTTIEKDPWQCVTEDIRKIH